MIKQIRNSVYTKILWGVMGLYLLNISADMADPHPAHIPENLSINDQESIIEVVVEQILGYEDVFQEYDDPDTEGNNKKTTAGIDIIVQLIADSVIEHSFIEAGKVYFPDYSAYLTTGFQKLDIPPPKI